MRLLSSIAFLALIAGELGAATIAANTQALYFSPLCSPENSGNDASANVYNMTQTGTVPFNSGACSTAPGSTYRAGPFSDSNYYTAPAALGTNLNGKTWNVLQGYIYLLSAASPSAYQTIVASTSTFITRLNVTNNAFRWDTPSHVLEGGSLSTNTCTHFAFVGTANSQTLYVNGVNVGSNVFNGIWPTNAPVFGTLQPIGFSGYYLNAYLDDVRFSAGSGSPPTTFPTVDIYATNTIRSPYLRQYPKAKVGAK